MKESIKPALSPEAKAAETDLYAAGYDCEFEKRVEHKVLTYRLEVHPRGGMRGDRIRIVATEAELSPALVKLAGSVMASK